MTKSFSILVILYLSSCTLPAEKKARAEEKKADTTHLHSLDTNLANRDILPSPQIVVPKPVKLPSGIFHGILPIRGRVEQTIAFYGDKTFRLQEEYKDKDSTVITEGSWTPSDGFIWLYKDQVARGRYRWKGDTLMYFSPFLHKNFTMAQMKEAGDNPAWKEKKNEGVQLYGTGTEPFWTLSLKKDSLSFQLSEWSKPIHLKLGAVQRTTDSSSFEATADSTRLQLIVYPYFCSDGMSDLIYRNKIKVLYNGRVYTGCGQ